MRSCLVLIISLFVLSPAVAIAAAEITSARAVQLLSAANAEKNLPVRVKGVVTCYVPASGLLFVQDESGGIYAFAQPWPRELAHGDVVEVTGVSGAGLFSPVIMRAAVSKTGERREPAARRVSLEELNTGRFDSEFVEIECVARAVEQRGDHTWIEAATGAARATALVYTNEKLPILVDSRIRLRGVAGAFFKEQRPTGFALFVPETKFVEVLRPGSPDPFAAPLRSSGQPLRFSPDGANDHRVRLQGNVLLLADQTLFLRDGDGTIRVDCVEKPSVEPGDLVEAAGFLNDPLGRATLERGVIRVTGKGPALEPTLLGPKDTEPEPGAVIAVEGICVAGSGDTIYLQRPTHAMTVYLFGKQSPPPPVNSRLRLSGVWFDDALWCATPPAIIAAPLGPTEGWRRGMLASVALGILSLAIMAAAAARAIKARKVEKAAQARARELDHQLRASLQERERLARDLHDSTIQSVYALGLNVEDAVARLKTEPEKADAGLRRVVPEINRIIRDLRNMIVGLETTTIRPAEFKTAMKSLGLALGSEHSGKVRLDLDPEAVEALNAAQATELLHIAREALINSAKHGEAQTVTVRLHKSAAGLRFTVEDDGKGFDPAAVRSGFGLRNMAKRAEHLGAKYSLAAKPGNGASITVEFAQETHA